MFIHFCLFKQDFIKKIQKKNSKKYKKYKKTREEDRVILNVTVSATKHWISPSSKLSVMSHSEENECRIIEADDHDSHGNATFYRLRIYPFF